MAAPVLTAQSPSTGYISWTAFNISYRGQNYSISAGNTNYIYVYWLYNGGSGGPLQGSNTQPTLTGDDLLLFLNKSGVPLDATSSSLIDGGLLVNGSIIAAALAANTITAAQIAAGTITSTQIAANTISASNIAAGAITASTVAAGAIGTAALAAGSVTATALAAGAVTANALNVTVGGSNLIVDSSFEGGTNAGVVSNGSTLTRSTAQHRNTGSYSMMSTAPTVGSGGANPGYALTMSLLGGYIYNFSFYIYVPTSGGITNGFFAAASSSGMTTQATTTIVPPTGAWTRYRVSFQPVADGTATMYVLAATPTTSGQVFYLDDLQLELGDVVTAYAPATNEILPGTIIANYIQAGAIGTTQIAASAVTATQIAAGAITANKLNITPGGGNLLVNSGFENSTWSGTGVPPGWTIIGAPTLTRETTTIYPVASSNSLKVVTTTANAYQGVYQTIGATTGALAYPVGSVLTGTAWVYATAGTNVRFLLWDGGSGSQVADSRGNNTTGYTFAATGWLRLQATATTTSGQMLIFIDSGNGHASGETFWVDDVQLEQGDTATSYAPMTSEILPGTIVTASIAAGAITTATIAANAVTATQIASGAITTNKLNVTIGGGNLVPNSSFENKTLYSTGWSNVASTIAVDTTVFWTGTQSVKMTVSTTGTAAYVSTTPATAIPVGAGVLVTGSAYARSSSATEQVQVTMNAYNSAGTYLSTFAGTTAANIGTTNTWFRFTATGTTPANTAYVSVAVAVSALNAVSGDNIWVDGVQLELGDTVTAYAPLTNEILPGTIVAASIAAGAVSTNALAAGSVTATVLAAGAVTANALNVTIGGGNLLANSSFENTTLATNWALSAAGPTLSSSTAQAWTGTSSALVTPAATPSQYNGIMQVVSPPTFSLNQTYSVSCYVYSTSAVSMFSYVQTFNGATVVQTFVGATVVVPANTWTRVTAPNLTPTTAPATTMQAGCETNVAPAAGTLIYFDAMQLEIGNVITAYAPATNEILPGTIVATSLAAGSVTTAAIAASAVTAATIAAGAITANKLAITIGGGNLLTNSGFEDSTQTQPWTGNSGTLTIISTNNAQQGTRIAQVVASGVTNMGVVYGASPTTGTPTGYATQYIRPNTTYTYSGYVYAPGGNTSTFGFYINFQNSSGALINTFQGSGTSSGVYQTVTNGAWTRVTVTATSGATGAGGYSTWGFWSYGAVPTNGTTYFFDAMQVEIGDTVTAYAPNANELLPGTISATYIQAGAIGTTQLAAGSVTTSILSAGAVTANKLLITVGGNNLITNSSFEDTTQILPWSAIAGTLTSVVLAGVESGGRVGQWASDGTANKGIQYVPATSAAYGWVPVTAGLLYSVSTYIEPATATRNFYIQVTWVTNAGATVSTATGTTTSCVTGTWTRVFASALTAPATATGAWISLICPDTLGSGEIIYFDAVQIEQGDVVTAYSPNTKELLPGTIVANMLAANSVTAASIAAGTITTTQIAATTITAGNIASGAITATQIAANTITTGNIAAATIQGSNIAANTLTASNFQANTITAGQIAANTITSGQIAANTITAAQIAAQTITAAQIAATTITGANIVGGTITGGNIAANTITGSNILANSVTADRIATGILSALVTVSGALGVPDLVSSNRIQMDGTLGLTLYASGTTNMVQNPTMVSSGSLVSGGYTLASTWTSTAQLYGTGNYAQYGPMSYTLKATGGNMTPLIGVDSNAGFVASVQPSTAVGSAWPTTDPSAYQNVAMTAANGVVLASVGQSVVFSVYAYNGNKTGNTLAQYVTVAFYNSSNAIIGTATSSTPTLCTSWTRLSVSATIPSTATQIRVTIGVHNTVTTVQSNQTGASPTVFNTYFAATQLEVGTTASVYCDQNQPNCDPVIYSGSTIYSYRNSGAAIQVSPNTGISQWNAFLSNAVLDSGVIDSSFIINTGHRTAEIGASIELVSSAGIPTSVSFGTFLPFGQYNPSLSASTDPGYSIGYPSQAGIRFKAYDGTYQAIHGPVLYGGSNVYYLEQVTSYNLNGPNSVGSALYVGGLMHPVATQDISGAYTTATGGNIAFTHYLGTANHVPQIIGTGANIFRLIGRTTTTCTVTAYAYSTGTPYIAAVAASVAITLYGFIHAQAGV